MEATKNTATEQESAMYRVAEGQLHDFEAQCIRVLRCTAQALVNTPGGFRFTAGTHPWLDALSIKPIGSMA